MAIYRCRICDERFHSREGPSMTANLWRCEDCDATQLVKIIRYPSPGFLSRKPPSAQELAIYELQKAAAAVEMAEIHAALRCPCGGKPRTDLKPMCPSCHSRDSEIEQRMGHYD